MPIGAMKVERDFSAASIKLRSRAGKRQLRGRLSQEREAQSHIAMRSMAVKNISMKMPRTIEVFADSVV